MKKPRTTSSPRIRPTLLDDATMADVAGGSGELSIGMPPTRATAGGDDDDPNGGIIIIGRDGP